MFVVFGESKFGKVDRVPGVCYVDTMFAHINYVPLFPTRSYVIVEGSETGNEFRGKHLGLSLKSVFAGYARAWGGVVTVLTAILTGITLYARYELTAVPVATLACMIVVGVCGGLSLFVSGRAGLVLQLVTHVCSGIVLVLFVGAGAGNATAEREIVGGQIVLLVVNVMLLLYCLIRLLDYAGPARRRVLMEKLGIDLPPEEEADPRHPDDRWEQWDDAEDRKQR